MKEGLRQYMPVVAVDSVIIMSHNLFLLLLIQMENHVHLTRHLPDIGWLARNDRPRGGAAAAAAAKRSILFFLAASHIIIIIPQHTDRV